MPGKHVPCAMCQDEAATVYCVNDDAHLCASCDVSVHAANPLLARHERRQLSCQAVECASAAHTSTSDDVAVVPQLFGAHSEFAPPAFAPAPKEADAAAVVAPAPLALYEDSFFARNLTTSDLLMDLEDDELELPGGASFASFDPLVDCVVPSFEAAPSGGYLDASASSGFASQHTTAFLPPYLRQQQQQYQPQQYQQQQYQQQNNSLVPSFAAPAAAPMAAARHAPSKPVDPAAEALRVQHHREKQRKKRAFGRAVRYQSRRAYAEIRPRIKGRFVTPEEYAVATGAPADPSAAPAAAPPLAAAAPAEKAGDKLYMGMGGYAPPASVMPALAEEDGVVPMPTAYLLA